MGRTGSMTATNAAAAPWQTENQPLTPFENFHSVFVVPTDYRNKSHKVKFLFEGFKNTVEVAKILEAKYIRLFSFYFTKGESYEE